MFRVSSGICAKQLKGHKLRKEKFPGRNQWCCLSWKPLKEALPWGSLFGPLIWSYCNLDFEHVNSEAEQHAVSRLQTASSFKSNLLDMSSAGVVLWRITHNKWLQSGRTQRQACQVREERFRHDVPLSDRMLKKAEPCKSRSWLNNIGMSAPERGPSIHLLILPKTPL